jgi:hypothetical protein
MISMVPRGFGVTAIALALTIVAASEGHAGYRVVAHPMPTLRTGIGVAAPAAQARLPQPIPQVSPVTTVRAAEPERDRGPRVAVVASGVIVAGIPSAYYYGPATYYAPGYYGGQYYDGGPAVGPSPLPDNAATDCAQIGDDGQLRPCP